MDKFFDTYDFPRLNYEETIEENVYIYTSKYYSDIKKTVKFYLPKNVTNWRALYYMK